MFWAFHDEANFFQCRFSVSVEATSFRLKKLKYVEGSYLSFIICPVFSIVNENLHFNRNLLKNWHKSNIYRSLKDLAVKLYHTNFSSNADSDLNKNSGGLTDLAKQ